VVSQVARGHCVRAEPVIERSILSAALSTASVVVVRTFTVHKRSKRGKRRLQWPVYVVFHCNDLSLQQIRRLYG
jgi:hypothetical protein